MSDRRFASWGALAVAVAVAAVCVVPAIVIGQQASPAAKTWKAPRTPDGRPDLQGFWTSLTYTPLERPKELAGKAFFTEQEAIEAFKKAVEDMDDQIVHYAHTDFGDTPVQTGARPNLRTSLVVDPPDGRIPALTPEAQKRQAARQAALKARGPLPVDRDRCRRLQRVRLQCRGRPDHSRDLQQQLSDRADAGKRADHLRVEHRAPRHSDGRPSAPAADHPHVCGRRAGEWEGETLVVETTNFSPKRNFYGSEGTFTLVERFTRISADTIEYKFTVEDPTTWTKPWSAIVPLYKIAGPMLEYACNENNQNPFTALKNARAQEKGLIAPANETRRGDPKAQIRTRENDAVKIGEGEGEPRSNNLRIGPSLA